MRIRKRNKEINFNNFNYKQSFQVLPISSKAVRNYFSVSGPERAPILMSQVVNMTNGKCIAHLFFKILI
jgi:hypothetical protein